ncbi:MAG: hypothetical protein FJW23_08625 [Acidimicrobiia bacterium]|nr:hypothetical protein [Acidimicrobiia bacterium]
MRLTDGFAGVDPVDGRAAEQHCDPLVDHGQPAGLSPDGLSVSIALWTTVAVSARMIGLS